jgi:DNA modification methylase
MNHKILCGDCNIVLQGINQKVDLTFLDPPFNQQKDYTLHNDNMPIEEYWNMMKHVWPFSL